MSAENKGIELQRIFEDHAQKVRDLDRETAAKVNLPAPDVVIVPNVVPISADDLREMAEEDPSVTVMRIQSTTQQFDVAFLRTEADFKQALVEAVNTVTAELNSCCERDGVDTVYEIDPPQLAMKSENYLVRFFVYAAYAWNGKTVNKEKEA